MNTIDIIRNIVAAESYDIPILSITDNGDDTFTLEVCNTRHQAAVLHEITLDGKPYKIVEVINNESIKILAIDLPAVEPVITVFPLAAPKFFHGTAIDVNTELVQVTDDNLKLPMVYLYEEFLESYNDDLENATDRTAALTLYLMEQANYGSWVVDEHYDNVINAMKNLASQLMTAFRNSKFISNLDGTHSETNKVNFGVFTVDGNEEQFLDAKMSGVQLQIDLPIERCTTCDPRAECNC